MLFAKKSLDLPTAGQALPGRPEPIPTAPAHFVNGVFSHYLENQLPFGGVNQSGMGSYHGYFGFKAFSHERSVYRHQ